MWSRIKTLLGTLFDVDPHERLKVIFLTIAFFFIIGAYTIAKDLKDAIFMSIVGKEYVPWAKVLSIFVLIPAILLYSKLVDKIRRYQLLVLYSALFGILGLVFAFFIGHPTIGIANTNTGPDRIFGWIFYCFVEGYSPFVVSVLWAFANSITSPEAAKKNYGLMVAGSKIGGMISAGCAWALFSMPVALPQEALATDVFNHQMVLIIASSMLLLVPFIVLLLMHKVPGRYLHGYEAVYQAEKQKGEIQEKPGIFSGLILLMKYPYVLGIFGMVFFYEIVSTVLSFLRLGVAQSNAVTISNVSSFLFELRFMMHAMGFFISLFGTRTLLKWLGERRCLLLIPLLSGILLLYFMIETTPHALVIAFVILQSINYAFSWPVRESLYIPTIKDIKFKSKSWIDAFGSKFAKTTGSTFNIIASGLGSSMLLPIHSFFFAGVISLWFIDAYLLGRRFEKAIMRNEVIGLQEEP